MAGLPQIKIDLHCQINLGTLIFFFCVTAGLG